MNSGVTKGNSNPLQLITRIVLVSALAVAAALLIGRATLFSQRNEDPLCKEAYRAVVEKFLVPTIEKENPIVTGYEFPSFDDCIVTHEGRYYVVTGQFGVLSEGHPRQLKDFASAVHRNPTNGNWMQLATRVYSAEPDPL